MKIMSTSPRKNYEVRAEVWEARNSLWVYSPSIWDASREFCIFSFSDENWSADSTTWQNEATVRLCVRKFPGNHRPDVFAVEINCLSLKAKITAPAMEIAVHDLEVELDKALKY